MRKGLVLFVSIVILLGVMLGMMMFETSGTDNTDDIVAQYHNTTNRVIRPISVTEVARMVEELSSSDTYDEPILPGFLPEDEHSNETPKDGSASPTPVMPGVVDPSDGTSKIDWLSIVDSAHKDWGSKGLKYSQTTTSFKDTAGNSITIRTDCSGYVNYCLYLAGFTSDLPGSNSSTCAKRLQDYGWTQVSKDNLVAGDILVYNGHVEVYHSAKDDIYPIVWNWGGAASAQNKYANAVSALQVKSYGTSGHKFSEILSAWHIPAS